MPHFLSRPSSPLLDSLQQQQLHVSLAPRNPLLHVWPHQSRREGSPLPTCWQHSSSCSPGYHPAFLVARAHCWPSCILWIYRLSRGIFPCKVTENLARCSVIILFSSWSRCSLKSSHRRTSVPQDTLESTWCKSGCKLCKLGKALTAPLYFKTVLSKQVCSWLVPVPLLLENMDYLTVFLPRNVFHVHRKSFCKLPSHLWKNKFTLSFSNIAIINKCEETPVSLQDTP